MKPSLLAVYQLYDPRGVPLFVIYVETVSHILASQKNRLSKQITLKGNHKPRIARPTNLFLSTCTVNSLIIALVFVIYVETVPHESASEQNRFYYIETPTAMNFYRLHKIVFFEPQKSDPAKINDYLAFQ